MVYKQKKSKKWSYKFMWNGELIRKSTKVTNKRVAEQMEAAHRTSLAKGEVGIRDRKPAPTLADFADRDFLPFVRTVSSGKPNTVRFYENSVNNLKAYAKLAGLRMDGITSESIVDYVAKRRAGNVEVSTVNRDLATLRRMFHLAQEWGKVEKVLPRVKLLPGENRRERVLTQEEEAAYLEAATAIGNEIQQDYQRALTGIRAEKRGQQPRTPDAFLLRDAASILIDCALRPEECFRLRWSDNIRDNAIEIHTGKGKGSRRRIPASPRVWAYLDMRKGTGQQDGWVFPADTKSGHMEASTIKKQHARAVKASGVAPFVLYTLRHTCITRWAKHVDPYTLHVLAGHTDMNTTMRYVHPNDADMREAMEKARGAATPVQPAGPAPLALDKEGKQSEK
jgi:integrase